MYTLKKLKADLSLHSSPEKAVFLPRFFKTGAGQYGEGDKFLGITVPDCRKVAKQYIALPQSDLIDLLHSMWHEERLTALLILVSKFNKANEAERQKIYTAYLKNTKYINNWDLVDLSSRDIVGHYIYLHPKLLGELDKRARSDLVWDRRIAIISTFYFLQKGDPSPTLRIAELLVCDSHDLIQKATGWMLRELAKRTDKNLLVDFLAKHYDHLPRTTLRYAIEHFSPEIRRRFMTGNFG